MKTTVIESSPAFRGQNFITPVHVEYRSGMLNAQRVHVEISKESPPYWSQTVERNPAGGPMYGVTIKRPNGRSLDPDLSRSCQSLEECLEYLASLGTEEEAESGIA